MAIPEDPRLAWFREAKFGLFVHWGIFTVPAGEWKGQTWHGVWIQQTADIPGEEYAKFASEFNPVGFNADQLASLAERAGMKYLVITAKNHDGFCMFYTKLTDYNVVDATPFARDPMKELSEACRTHGIRLCFYYSVKDWHHPEYPTLYTRRTRTHPDGFHAFPNPHADYMKYLAYLQGQVRELLTNYGTVGIMWFDWCGCALTEQRHRERAHEIVEMIHEIQPDCLINNRFCEIGADYGTPEQHIPREGQKAEFEVCMTLNDNWSYNRHDRNWKDPGTVIHNLVDIAGKGGNYLLGVGPTAEGLVPDEAVRILDEVGRWLRANGESIYGAGQADRYLRWDREVDVVTAKPGRYYLHVFRWPEDNRIFLYDFRKHFKRAYLLADRNNPLKADVYRRSVMVHVPTQAPDPIDSVTVVEYEEAP